MSVLLVAVPPAREVCGRAIVLSSAGRTIFGPIRILATASARVARANGNPVCSPRLPFGHPPLGSYVIAASLAPGHRHRRGKRYGRLGALVLHPVGGEAATAARRIVLHGGPLDPKGRLRPTRGGLRVSDRDMAALLRVVNAANDAGDPLSLVELVEAKKLPVPVAGDHPGGRRLAGRSALARRRFLGASALLLASMAAGAAGCNWDTPSCYQPVRSDWSDGGTDGTSVPPPVICDDNGSYTGGGGFG